MMQRLSPQTLTRFLKNKNIVQRMPRGFQLERADIHDLDSLLNLAGKCFSYDVPDRRTMRYFIVRAHAAFFVLRQNRNSAIVGYSLVEANRRTKTLYVNTICIDLSLRGKGLGKLLCGVQTQLLAASGYHSMTAHVRKNNRASMRLFKNQGFAVVEEIDNYYYDDGSSSYKMRLRSNTAP